LSVFDSGNGVVERDSVAPDPVGEPFGQFLQSALERDEEGVARAAFLLTLIRARFLHRFFHRPDKGPVFLLHLGESGQGRLQAQFGGVPSVDPPDKGLDDPFERFFAEPPRRERGERLFFVALAARQEQLEPAAQFAPRGQERRYDHRVELGRRHRHESVRERVEFPVPDDERAAVLAVRRLKFRFEPELFAEVEPVWRCRDEVVDAQFAQEIANFTRADNPADPVGLLEDRKIDVGRRVAKLPSCGKTGDSGAYDSDSWTSSKRRGGSRRHNFLSSALALSEGGAGTAEYRAERTTRSPVSALR
jgi:hypothetical protein